MSTRRDALRILVGTPALVPAVNAAQETKEVGDQPGHLHAGPTVKIPAPSKPTFFQPEELQLVEALAERIIPRTDTPGARDAGVALLIDKAIVGDPSLGPPFRSGIADLNALASDTYGKRFTVLSEAQQITLLTPLSLDNHTALGKFFALAKGMTVQAYYNTEVGLKSELGWHGNTYLKDFPGCDHPEHHS